jgi:diacylglycerol kinase (ATP)
LRALRRYRPVACRVSLDGEPWRDGPMLLVAVANGSSFGQGMRVAPMADPADGALEVVFVAEVPRWQLLFRLGQLLVGRHLGSRYVAHRRARSVLVEPAAALPPLDLDGEHATLAGTVEMRVLPHALRVVR